MTTGYPQRLAALLLALAAAAAPRRGAAYFRFAGDWQVDLKRRPGFSRQHFLGERR